MRPPSELDSNARMPAEAEEVDPRAPAMMICARLAGRAIIRVVGRCEDAQENSQLGKWPLSSKHCLLIVIIPLYFSRVHTKRYCD